MVRNLLALVLAMFAAPTAGCAGEAQADAPLVLAAASLQDALEAVADEWAASGHTRPVLSFAGTSALARQIEAGAPADLFISADEAWMDYVAQGRFIVPESRTTFLANALVLIAPAGSDASVEIGYEFPLAAALGEGRLAMADPDAVPAGRYGKQALLRLGAWTSVQDRIASAENVRAALALVARGEAPLGIVYATDAGAEPRVRIVARFPEGSHRPIHYPLALLKSSSHPQAEGFRAFLLSDEAQAIFRKHGFGTPEKP